MIQAINKKIDLKIKAVSYLGLPSYGIVLVGNNGFEYYNNKNAKDFIQIPWNEVDYIAASVLLGGRWINRFAIFTKKNGDFSFSTSDNKKTLRAISNYIPKEKLVKSKTFLQIIFLGIKSIFKKR
ncbi:DUF956 family protein [Oceanivirga salmonicida]|uniref:DUF956 family protein n=1 Tax=Oceanivirga salmonicida TaxID=1769291 RepID=UPI00082DCAF0|nr:DUF956 family protein [Oceanivirga salmonicida]